VASAAKAAAEREIRGTRAQVMPGQEPMSELQKQAMELERQRMAESLEMRSRLGVARAAWEANAADDVEAGPRSGSPPSGLAPVPRQLKQDPAGNVPHPGRPPSPGEDEYYLAMMAKPTYLPEERIIMNRLYAEDRARYDRLKKIDKQRRQDRMRVRLEEMPGREREELFDLATKEVEKRMSAEEAERLRRFKSEQNDLYEYVRAAVLRKIRDARRKQSASGGLRKRLAEALVESAAEPR
jgi:hypothetical protein